MNIKVFKSSNADVQKFVFEFHETMQYRAAIAEAVLYRYESFRKRTVICCSVQSGCPVGCTFCGTGKFFVRNLSRREIVAQVKAVLDTIDCDTKDIKKFQIMFMSMGEPFLNPYHLMDAIDELSGLYPNAQLLVSTSAPANILAPFNSFVHMSMRNPKIGLQFSVHESTDEARRKLIPTATCTLRQIATLGELWATFTGRKPYFNYCVHEGNGSLADAQRLSKIFNPDVWEATLSVICEKDESVKASIERQLDLIKGFDGYMADFGFHTRVFNPAGQDDIGGGCGQLWYFQEWLKQKGGKQ